MSAAVQSLPELLSYLDGQAEPRIVMDSDYRIIAANRAYSREIARGRPVSGRFCYELSHHYTVPCDQAGESCPLRLSQESGQMQRVLHLHHTPRGEVHVDVETTPIRNQRGKVVYFVETLRILKQASIRPAAKGLVGRSPRFNRMLSLVLRVAPTDAAVLLQGETGTGKEVVAAIIHETSKRALGPFVVVDCSGLTETLFESELFGYEKGAFTGATHRKTGLVEAAGGGTLFLDEVGDIPLPLQVKLLRLLETGTFRRVGGIETTRCDFRLLCATHRDLLQMVEAGSFRRDLYFRISTFPIAVPSLAERREDIPLLAAAFLKRVGGGRELRLSKGAIVALKNRVYAGNIRELRNLLERASILADGNEIMPIHFDAEDLPRAAVVPVAEVGENSFLLHQAISLEELEKRYLDWVATQIPGDRKSLAKRLGVGTRTLYRKLSSVNRAGVVANSKTPRTTG
ncbi:MAG TPA: sigma-54-dependent Fis family transcriptional regulator [Rhodocyclaceae bacterium]|nr:sigma-54-dependent Fis family transcriptional regulator [Rhodocyclaceae bacterium]